MPVTSVHQDSGCEVGCGGGGEGLERQQGLGGAVDQGGGLVWRGGGQGMGVISSNMTAS